MSKHFDISKSRFALEDKLKHENTQLKAELERVAKYKNGVPPIFPPRETELLNEIDNFKQERSRLLSAVEVLRETLDKNKQSIRYLLKHQNFPVWDDMTEFQKGFSVACQLAEKGISEEALAKADELLKEVE